MGLKLDLDASLKIDENGVSVKVKGFNTNNFIIDKVFNKLNKKKKKEKSSSDKIESGEDVSLLPDFSEECVDNLVKNIEVDGPIKINI